MKYLLYFKENFNNYNQDIVFENEKWTIIKPSSYESCCYWCQDTDWRVSDGTHEYYYHKDKTYIVIEKEKDNKYFLDFYTSYFHDKDEDKIYLKEFLDKSSVLYNYFGEDIECVNVKEQNNQWWIVVNDYDFFTDYFKLDRDTRSDLIKIILSGDYFDIFQYSYSDFKITDQDIDLTPDNLLIFKIILRIEQYRNPDEYDYDLNDINDYSDIASIVHGYNIDNLKDAIQGAICEAQESADGSSAWNDIVNKIYNFFGLVDGSAKWEKANGFKNDALWIKFKSKTDAINAKFILTNYDDSFDDDNKIDYSTPYNGYYGKSKDVEDSFNECIKDKIVLRYDKNDDITYTEIDDYYEYWKEEMKKNPNATDDEIAEEVQFYLDAKKYNL